MRQQPRTIRIAPWGLALALSLSLVVSDQAVGQVSLGTAFTYQGELEQGGSPVTDMCEFEFLLFDAPLGGVPIGAIPPAVVEIGVALTPGAELVNLGDAGHSSYFEIAADFNEVVAAFLTRVS